MADAERVAIEGTIQVRSYDAQDGTKRYVTEIVADSVEFLTSKTDQGLQPKKPGQDEFVEVDDDELPF